MRWERVGLGEVESMEVVDWDVSVVVEREFEGVESGGVWVWGYGLSFVVWDCDEHHGWLWCDCLNFEI